VTSQEMHEPKKHTLELKILVQPIGVDANIAVASGGVRPCVMCVVYISVLAGLNDPRIDLAFGEFVHLLHVVADSRATRNCCFML
jgi:hypothetical protein